MVISIDLESYSQGVRDGATSKRAPAWALGRSKGSGRDSFSYCSGRIEGEAFRDGYEVTLDDAAIAAIAVAERAARLT